MTKTSKTSSTDSQTKHVPASETGDIGAVTPRPVRQVREDEPRDDAVHTLPQTPNPGNPEAITGTAVPLSTNDRHENPNVSATGDTTGLRRADRDIDRDADK